MAGEMAYFHVSGGIWFQNCKCSWLTASVTMLLRPSYTLTYVITDIRPMHTSVPRIIDSYITIRLNLNSNIDHQILQTGLKGHCI